MTPILLLLAFPLLTIVGMKIWRSENFSWLEAGVQLVLTLALVVGGYQFGKSLEMTSVEFWTGTITSKTHEDGHYQTSYSCNCRESCSGSGSNRSCTETCDTCYTDHYTREWILNTTVGKIVTSNIDTEIRSRRNNFGSDSHWNDAYKGEACSVTNSYTNYVAAAESSLHHRSGTNEQYAKTGVLIDYPQIHGKYHLNRVMAVGVGVPEMDKWLSRLNEYMGTLGGLKQINIFVIFVPDTLGESYTDALQAHWRGANKNDTVLVIGINKQTKDIGWVDTITWAKSNIYAVTLREEIVKVGNVREGTSDKILGIINEATLKHYERRPMKEFEHLAKEIKPPTWIMVILVIIAIPGSLVLAYIFDRIDLAELFNRRGGGRYRRSSGIRIRRRRF